MSAFYEVWDYESRNQINSFETEAAARAFLRRLLDLNGPDGVRELAIVRQARDAHGEYEPTLIVDGAQLLAGEPERPMQSAGGPPEPGGSGLEESARRRRAAS